MTELPALVGSAESADILGVPTSTITRRRKNGSLPKGRELKATTVWLRAHIEAVRDGLPWDEAELDALPPLAGTSEAATICEVDKSQIGRWRRTGKFPEPDAELRAGPLWIRPRVQRFARAAAAA